MATKCVLSGGAFQDSEGNPLSLGYLIFELSQDCSVSGVGNIAAGITVQIQLDANGNVAGSPGASIWGNDVLSPQPNFYKVTGYTVAGQPSWGPNNQQVTGGSFNLGTWVPNTVILWSPTVGQPLVLENAGVPLSSQTLLNFESSDASVTITDEGGGLLNFQSVGSAPTLPAGTNVIPIICTSDQWPTGGTGITVLNAGGSTNSLCQIVPGNALLCTPTHWKITLDTYSASTVIKAVMMKCTKNTGTVLSITSITFSGSPTPTLAPAGRYTSDSIALTLSTSFDYFIVLNTSTGLINSGDNGTGRGGMYGFSSDQTAASTLTFTGGSPEYGKLLTFDFQSA